MNTEQSYTGPRLNESEILMLMEGLDRLSLGNPMEVFAEAMEARMKPDFDSEGLDQIAQGIIQRVDQKRNRRREEVIMLKAKLLQIRNWQLEHP